MYYISVSRRDAQNKKGDFVMKKIVSSIFAVAIAAGMLSGCGDKQGTFQPTVPPLCKRL